MNKQFLNTPDDCQWLRETHLRSLPMLHWFKSFTLTGTEDSPEAVVLFRSNDPLLTDRGTKVMFGDGTFAIQFDQPGF